MSTKYDDKYLYFHKNIVHHYEIIKKITEMDSEQQDRITYMQRQLFPNIWML